MTVNSRAAAAPPPASNFSDASPANTVAENIARISELERAARRELTSSERISKAITDFAGSIRFLLLLVAVFVSWALWNLTAATPLRFDPYPFGLMTVLVSLVSVFLATFVLITQNRMLGQAERRDHLGLQVTMLTEQELTIVLRMLRQLCERAGIEPETTQDGRVEELMQETNVYDVMKEIDRNLPKE